MQKLFKDKDATHFKNGKMQLQTEFPFYEPGNDVNGIIYIQIDEFVSDAKGFELEVKGGGKNSFTRYWTEWEGEGEERHPV